MSRFTEKETSLFIEDMNLRDFKSAASVSARVQAFRRRRKNLLKSEIKSLKLVDCRADRQKDFIEFRFLSVVTPDGKKKYRTDPTNNFSLIPNPTGTYEIELRLEKFFTWLFDTMPDGKIFTPSELRSAMEVSSIKMWDDDPSLYWQGFAYNLSQLDASIHTVTIPPKHWNIIHEGDFFLSKHMTALIMNIDFFYGPMTSKLSKTLKTMGILDVGYAFNYL
ncbi:MAG: hypothetical protein ACRCZB_05405 [Bacteroidales bacterium]